MNTKRMLACAAVLLAVAAPATVPAQTQPSVSRQIFLNADLNKDGFIDIDEFHKDVVRGFHALDHNRDGYISAEEIRSIPDKTRVELILKMLKIADKDGDGKLSFREVVERRMAFFDAADFDKDDRLSMTEVIAYDAEAVRRAALAAASGGTRGK